MEKFIKIHGKNRTYPKKTEKIEQRQEHRGNGEIDLFQIWKILKIDLRTSRDRSCDRSFQDCSHLYEEPTNSFTPFFHFLSTNSEKKFSAWKKCRKKTLDDQSPVSLNWDFFYVKSHSSLQMFFSMCIESWNLSTDYFRIINSKINSFFIINKTSIKTQRKTQA